MFVITNMLITTHDEQVQLYICELNNNKILENMVVALQSGHPCLIQETIQALEVLLMLDKSMNLQGESQISYKFEIIKGCDVLEQLQVHPNHAIYKLVE